MHICFITNKYPNKIDKNTLIFLKQLVDEVSKQKIKCSVICPVPTNINSNYKKLPYTQSDGEVNIYYPRYFGLGQKNYLFFNPARITTHFFTKKIQKTIDENNNLRDIDAFYAHFVTPAGIAAARLGKIYKKPAFMAYGEATLDTINHFGKKGVKKELSSLSGVIAVSTQNKQMISKYVNPNIVKVFPNAIDLKKFKPINKHKSRKKFGFKDEDFIVSFVGSFDKRKGIDRLEKAIDRFNGKVKLAAAGKGELKPKSKYCIWNKPVKHSDLPFFYSASDIFVLPTRNEGCCNAIIEAMGCGKAIISSDKSFNYDILNKDNSILINPDSVEEIEAAIKQLKNDRILLRQKEAASILTASKLTLAQRAKRIIGFMNNGDNNA